jgi:hypothetical protein
MAEERKTFLLRVDPAVWRDIEKWAADELRSANGQIEFILREALRRRLGQQGAGGPPAGEAGGTGAPPGSP